MTFAPWDIRIPTSSRLELVTAIISGVRPSYMQTEWKVMTYKDNKMYEFVLSMQITDYIMVVQ